MRNAFVAGRQKMTADIGHRIAEVSDTLAAAVRALQSRTQAPRLEAEILLAHVLGVDRSVLLTRPEAKLPVESKTHFENLISRRIEGEPVAYLTGNREFWSIDLEVSSDVLIPRPQTERLVEAALDRIPGGASFQVADLGTGCGAVAIAISRERPLASILATDVSTRALAVAQRNVNRAGATNIRLLACSWLEAIASLTFDVIVSNPPYVRDSDPHLRQGDLPMEPRLALAGGPDGLRAICVIVAGARFRLAKQGVLLLEHGFDQGPAVRRMLEDAGYRGIFSLNDYAGHERVTGGQR